MDNLKINYMGIDLDNPIIIGASNMVTDLENLKKAEEAGAAAIIFKSLFKEQIQLERFQMDGSLSSNPFFYQRAQYVDLILNSEELFSYHD